jgi:hypothetical protein
METIVEQTLRVAKSREPSKVNDIILISHVIIMLDTNKNSAQYRVHAYVKEEFWPGIMHLNITLG